MKQPKRFAAKGLFSLAVQKAVTDYDRSRGTAHWRQAELDEIAKSSAIQHGLSYDGAEVDPAIAKAIRVMSDTKLSMDEGTKALDEAWEAYRKHS